MSDQADSEDKNKKQVPVDPNLGDWSPDYFPVSAKPIFKRSLILLGAVAVLCFSVAYCSEHADENQPTKTPDPSNQQNQDDIPDNDTDLF